MGAGLAKPSLPTVSTETRQGVTDTRCKERGSTKEKQKQLSKGNEKLTATTPKIVELEEGETQERKGIGLQTNHLGSILLMHSKQMKLATCWVRVWCLKVQS